jgi:hypothetical protein
MPPALFYLAAILSLAIGLFHTLRPVFVPLATYLRIERNDAHDKKIRTAISLAALFAISPYVDIFSSTSLMDIRIHSDISFDDFFNTILSAIFALFLYGFIFWLTSEFLLSWINQKIKKRTTIRPLCCQDCRKPLKKINSSIFLSEIEKVAERAKNITFEAYNCKQCCTIISRNNIHLRAYISSSDQFRFCENCREFTMTETARKEIKRATSTTEGKCLVIYTCQHCNMEKEKIEKIATTDK